MTRGWRWLALVAVLAMPVTLHAQQHRRGETPRGLRGAVERLYENRERLGLSVDQLARLGEVKTSADALKQPLLRRIMELRGSSKAASKADPPLPAEERRALLEHNEAEIEQLSEQLRTIDHGAMRQIGGILSEEQRKLLYEIVRRDRDGRDRDRGHSDQKERGDHGV